MQHASFHTWANSHCDILKDFSSILFLHCLHPDTHKQQVYLSDPIRCSSQSQDILARFHFGHNHGEEGGEDDHDNVEAVENTCNMTVLPGLVMDIWLSTLLEVVCKGYCFAFKQIGLIFSTADYVCALTQLGNSRGSCRSGFHKNEQQQQQHSENRQTCDNRNTWMINSVQCFSCYVSKFVFNHLLRYDLNSPKFVLSVLPLGSQNNRDIRKLSSTTGKVNRYVAKVIFLWRWMVCSSTANLPPANDILWPSTLTISHWFKNLCKVDHVWQKQCRFKENCRVVSLFSLCFWLQH